MNYRRIGTSGIKVSEVAIGSWMTDLTGSDQARVATEVLNLAFEKGINFFDCADAYGNGQAEQFLGEVLKKYPRNQLVLSSKVFFPTDSDANGRGLSRKHIVENIDRTLKNMQVDYIDLYYCHRYDTETNLTETLRTLSDLVTQGKILYYGVSEEWSAARIIESQKIIEQYQLHPMTVIQPQYHMMDRYIEHEIIDVCQQYGIGITPFSPLAQGLLTGKYKKGASLPAGSRATHQADKQINALLTEENLDKVEKLSSIAANLDISMSVLALAWILRQSTVASVITGASTASQLENNIKASGVQLSPEVLAEIEKILGFQRFERHVG